jgi:hypothetical protein
MVLLLTGAHADRLTLHDGTVIENCYIRDEGVRLIVWERLEDVGTDRWKVYPRRLVKEFTIERDAAWDAKPNLPDLTVTHIELNPKLAGLHGRVDYDPYGRPKIVGGSLPDLGERAYMEPEAVVQGLKFQYTPGETLTMTAHVKNVGFADAAPFEYVWLIDDKEIARGRVTKRLKPQERIELQTRWQWQDGFHHVSFRIRANQREIATINNQITDPLWGFAFFYIVHKERVKVWNEFRNAYGTFAWEDYYRWHLDIMNLLFEQSVFPSAPEGIKARVRLDRIIYADDMDEAIRNRFSADGIAYDQGGWIFISDEDRNRDWKAPEPQWRNNTEWSLPHELGHQLGLTDLYALDYHGHENHRMPDNGDMLTHYYRGYKTMMHWHGPHLWSEVCAGYLEPDLEQAARALRRLLLRPARRELPADCGCERLACGGRDGGDFSARRGGGQEPAAPAAGGRDLLCGGGGRQLRASRLQRPRDSGQRRTRRGCCACRTAPCRRCAR